MRKPAVGGDLPQLRDVGERIQVIRFAQTLLAQVDEAHAIETAAPAG